MCGVVVGVPGRRGYKLFMEMQGREEWGVRSCAMQLGCGMSVAHEVGVMLEGCAGVHVQGGASWST